MIYFDNAATGGFKPRAVTDTAETVIRYLSANPGRSGHRLSVSGAQIVCDCRNNLSNFFGSKSDRVIFTKNCTEALNVSIFGCLNLGDHVITTTFEHNSVLRPLHSLKSHGTIELDVVKPSSTTSIEKAIENAVKVNTKLIVCTAVSNVTGEVFPIDKIAQIAKANGILFLVDGAQGGGHVPLKVNNGVSMLAVDSTEILIGATRKNSSSPWSVSRPYLVKPRIPSNSCTDWPHGFRFFICYLHS